MKLRNLTESETETVRACLQCVAEGNVILHDFEFSSLIGVEVSEFIDIYNQWPEIDESNEIVNMAMNNAMNNLLGYCHGRHDNWSDYMDISLDEIRKVFEKWRGE